MSQKSATGRGGSRERRGQSLVSATQNLKLREEPKITQYPSGYDEIQEDGSYKPAGDLGASPVVIKPARAEEPGEDLFAPDFCVFGLNCNSLQPGGKKCPYGLHEQATCPFLGKCQYYIAFIADPNPDKNSEESQHCHKNRHKPLRQACTNKICCHATAAKAGDISKPVLKHMRTYSHF